MIKSESSCLRILVNYANAKKIKKR